jgi:hypothetical protein
MSSEMLAINMTVFLNEVSQRYLKASFLGATAPGLKYPSRNLKHCQKIQHAHFISNDIVASANRLC